MNMRYFNLVMVTLVGLVSTDLVAQSSSWGWQGHTYINEHAVDYLPAEMSFFLDYVDFLGDHAADPDVDSEPSNYHYIDIDFYPEFFEGTLPHDIDELADLYSNSIVEDNGLIPWVVEIWCDSLTSLMASGQWDDAWQVAAELGHYVADSHQPLHLTLNYDGEETGNDGIHSRYETTMVNQNLSNFDLEPGTGEFWPNVLDSTFNYIDDMYPYVEDIMVADDLASASDPNYNSEYYDIMWQELEELTTISVRRACYDLACIWITCWENAGSPNPNGTAISDVGAEMNFAIQAYPNPASNYVTLELELTSSGYADLVLFDSNGKPVLVDLVAPNLSGKTVVNIDTSKLISGAYIYRLSANGGALNRGLILVNH